MTPVTKTMTKSRDVVFYEEEFSDEKTENMLEYIATCDQNKPMEESETNEEVTVIYGNDTRHTCPQIPTKHEDPSTSSDSSEEQIAINTSTDPPTENKRPSLSKQMIAISQMKEKLPPRTRKMTEKGEAYKSKKNKICHVSFGESRDIPVTYNQAIKCAESQKWIEAIGKEWEAMLKNSVFEVVANPDRKPIKSKWVFDKKTNERGEVTRYKARLCAKGFTQIFGVDFNLTFSPTIDRCH